MLGKAERLQLTRVASWRSIYTIYRGIPSGSICRLKWYYSGFYSQDNLKVLEHLPDINQNSRVFLDANFTTLAKVYNDVNCNVNGFKKKFFIVGRASFSFEKVFHYRIWGISVYSTMILWTVLSIFLTMLMVYILIKPNFLTSVYRKKIGLSMLTSPVGMFNCRYQIIGTQDPEKELVVWLPGGALVSSVATKRTIRLATGLIDYLETNGRGAWGMIVEYGVYPEFTLSEMIQNILMLINYMSPRVYHIVGHSAGGYLGGLIASIPENQSLASKLNLTLPLTAPVSFTGICPMIKMSRILSSIKPNDLVVPPLSIPTLICGSKRDFLYEQSLQYIQQSGANYVMIDDLDHRLNELTPGGETLLYENIGSFIKLIEPEDVSNPDQKTIYRKTYTIPKGNQLRYTGKNRLKLITKV